jgi:hypothetical protein
VKNHDANKVNNHLLRSAIKPFARYCLIPFPCRNDTRDCVCKNYKNCKNQKMLDGKEKRKKDSATNGINYSIISNFKNVVDYCFHDLFI